MTKRCLIIGGSSDIGAATALKTAEAGINVAVHYHSNYEKVKELERLIPKDRWISSYFGDLSTNEGIESFLEEIPDEWDMLVFSPGNHSAKLMQDVTPLEMDDYYHIHVKSLWMITKKLIPHMVQRKQGNIVVVSSVWGEEGASTEVVYSSVKGAQISFVKALAKELAPSKIRVNAVTPGFIATKMNQSFTDDETMAIFQDIPLGRAGECGEVAEGIKYLLQEQSSYITGHVLKINGGWY
ncbi:elongation factor P 5-aminopentanone reductase [Halobacillus campisalis]|uniref:Elongation factor P 5-aminopentanone reductase n=1 Tax=Halobacillus campisalis TaxID=435909 RepID=A0ABW2K333_9BACI|nr:SDR family oxidoreductase [Halobacillus campisalis]